MHTSLGVFALLFIRGILVNAQAAGVNPDVTIGVLAGTSTEQTTPDPQATQVISYDPNLVGTWSSKSNKTFTGPGFYDPKNERLIEPSHTGISYSFTEDGHYEVAYYRAIANPQQPACPSGIMQWQHGTYQILKNGSIITMPIKVDGRQLLSDPCNYDGGIFTRWNQSELFQKYAQYKDPYHNIPRLDLFRFDGSPLMPLYLAFKGPEMLPTTTLNPLPATASGSRQASSIANKSRRKRDLEDTDMRRIIGGPRNWVPADIIFWFGVGATGVGSVMYFCF